ncbi:uncharacterized protein LOC124929331 [Impatiens glandulifera]|uniref:uncharacterized protein LOC124929331 n=1 Tax=Impatiens glandulifera TaxID=253017 RepID=UPI001FB10DFA|nr:uncharacterized protein LOC124929331 [Impatiens glandulifera]
MMSSSTAVVAAGPSSSFTTRRSNNNNNNNGSPVAKQRITFHGLPIQDAKNSISSSNSLILLNNNNNKKNNNNNSSRRGLEISAKTAGASKNIEVEVDKPLGLTLGQKPGGGVVITAIDGGGNAAKAGLKTGDQVIYTSSFFGDELWPADKLGFTKTAIQAKPDSVYFVVARGGPNVDVKRLPKRPAPPRFGTKLTDAQKARATHICLDCGYIYTLQKPFDEQADGYVCPQCLAPKKRFAEYDVKTGRAIGGSLPPISVIIGLLVGIGGVAALLLYGLQ